MMGQKGREKPPGFDEDRALVQRLLAGEADAFEQLFEECYDGLYRFTLTRVGHDELLAEELTQAAFVQALEKLDTYRGEAALFSWLCTFCRYEASAHFRRQRRTPRSVDGPEEDGQVRAALDAMAAGVAGPDDSLESKQAVARVHEALDSLRPKYRQVLAWKYFDDLSVSEIAERLDRSPKAVESLLTRSREAFRIEFAAKRK